MTERRSRNVYGPVPSRRLGSSLGVDIIPFKYCSYDCVYCQLGRTTEKTIERREYVPVNDVLEELKTSLKEGPEPAYISLAGSGEPTLNAESGSLIRSIKSVTDIPVAILTNGSLLWMPEVRESLMSADLVLPSLDAGTGKVFRAVNRPHSGISFGVMVEGLARFASDFAGSVWLEVMVMAGLTDTREQIESIVKSCQTIGPERVQLNTVYRPPAEDCARTVSLEAMTGIRNTFPGFVEIVSPSDAAGAPGAESVRDREGAVLSMIRRRPCTAADVAAGLGLHITDAVKSLDRLSKEGTAVSERLEDRIYYRPADQIEEQAWTS